MKERKLGKAMTSGQINTRTNWDDKHYENKTYFNLQLKKYS